MSHQRSYRWRPEPWRVGQKVAVPRRVPTYSQPEEGGKTGTILLVLVGVATVAFGVMELLGVTKVFAKPSAGPAPAPAAAAVPAAVPATPPVVPAP